MLPAKSVQLATVSSLFPRQLNAYWKTRGIETVTVSKDISRAEARDLTARGPGKFVSAWEKESRAYAALRSVAMHAGAMLEGATFPYIRDYHERRTKRVLARKSWEWGFCDKLASAYPLARSALAENPSFVFGQEIGDYGLATALCRRVPTFLFPWGGDVYYSAETSPAFYAMIHYALHAVDLVFPSSTSAAKHIVNRFALPPEKVMPISWGIDLQRFTRAEGAVREQLREKWRIPPGKKVLLNSRRFHPDWGGDAAIAAFIEVLRRRSDVQCVVFSGPGTEALLRDAERQIARHGLADSFTLLFGELPLSDVAELMSLSDVFLSLMTLGDMRSASVLQAAAAGGTPILSRSPEWSHLTAEGFRALLVNPSDSDETSRAILDALINADWAASVRRDNRLWLEANENCETQLARMLDAITLICERRQSPLRS
jgi:glycosyltransferase involved in cell wall biosynthesis